MLEKRNKNVIVNIFKYANISKKNINKYKKKWGLKNQEKKGDFKVKKKGAC